MCFKTTAYPHPAHLPTLPGPSSQPKPAPIKARAMPTSWSLSPPRGQPPPQHFTVMSQPSLQVQGTQVPASVGPPGYSHRETRSLLEVPPCVGQGRDARSEQVPSLALGEEGTPVPPQLVCKDFLRLRHGKSANWRREANRDCKMSGETLLAPTCGSWASGHSLCPQHTPSCDFLL